MGFAELLLIGIGLSMDAFAVSVCKGLGMKKPDKLGAVIIALFFGGFQAIMPLIGWTLGRQFEGYITAFDHWISFALLSFIGGKMLYETLGDKEQEISVKFCLNIKELFALAVATSIDALAIGVTLAFLRVKIIQSVVVIGVTTFIISLIGIYIGYKFGSKFEKKAEIAGGIILILIGLKILLEHLGIFTFLI